MILKYIVPPKIGSYRLYNERCLALHIDGTILYGAVVTWGHSKVYIEQLFQHVLEDVENYEYVHGIIKDIIKKNASVDQIRIVIPSSMVIFKEMTLSFTDTEKIAFVLPYELEPLIPFSLEESVVSFLVNEIHASNHSAHILAAAARSSDIEQHMQAYKDVSVDAVTVDVIALHGLFQSISSYAAISGLHCFIILYERSIRIVLATEKGIKVTKNIYQGIGSLAQKYMESQGSNDYPGALKHVLQAFASANFDEQLLQLWNQLLSEIQFVIQALLVQYTEAGTIAQIWVAGPYATTTGLVPLIRKALNTECKLFEAEKIVEQKKYVYKGSSVGSWTPYAHALGAALPLAMHEHFNLKTNAVKEKQENVLKHLWATAFAIMVFVFVGVGAHGFYYVQQLQSTYDRMERSEIAVLKPLLQASQQKVPKVLTLKRAQTMAESALQTKKESWSELQKQAVTPLDVWYELTKLFDKNRFDVKVETIAITREEGPLKADIAGIFRSKTGSDHFTHFADFEKRFFDAKILALDSMNESLTDDGSVQFNTFFKVRES